MGQMNLNDARILVIDDDPNMALLLQTMLEREGYANVVSLCDPTQAPEVFDAFAPDLVLTDLHMPQMNGLDLIAALRDRSRHEYLPIVMLTGDVSREARLRALRTGATDFLEKPFDDSECRLRIHNLLQTRFLYQEVQEQRQLLEQRVAERTIELQRAKFEILERLAMAAEFRDDETGRHTQRVGRLCAQLAQTMGLPEQQVALIRQAAPLHDVGKIGIPDDILLKPGRLTPDEFQTIKQHTVIGSRLLSKSISAPLRLAQKIALTHHERWDGRGYSGLAGERIPLAGRVLAVADVFDALTNVRPYKDAWSVEEAVDEIASQRGRQFDPEVVDAFMTLKGKVDLRDPAEVMLPEKAAGSV